MDMTQLDYLLVALLVHFSLGKWPKHALMSYLREVSQGLQSFACRESGHVPGQAKQREPNRALFVGHRQVRNV